uniref:Tetratricopeptide repeat protein 39B n=1 Tax=Parascaris univalens TaxID=6257 RepID=A0A915ARP3_PARUN
ISETQIAMNLFLNNEFQMAEDRMAAQTRTLARTKCIRKKSRDSGRKHVARKVAPNAFNMLNNLR